MKQGQFYNQCIMLKKMALSDNEVPIGVFIKYTDLKQN